MQISLNTTRNQANGTPRLSDVNHIGSQLRVARGDAIFQAGDAADNCYYVVKGVVRLTRLLLDGRRHVADFRVSGDLLAFDSDEAYDVTAEAVTDVTLVRYRRREIDQLTRQSSKLQTELLQITRMDVLRLQNRILQLGCQTAKERLASFLVGLADRGDEEAEDGCSIELPMTRQDIGDYLGLTVETISRTLGELKRDGAIRVVNRSTILLDDVEGLRLMAEGDADDEPHEQGRRCEYQGLAAHH